MEIRFGHIDGQQTLDEQQLEHELTQELNLNLNPIRFFIDTIDEVSEVKHFEEDGHEYIIIRIPASEYDQQENKLEFVKEKIHDALQLVL